MASVKEVDFLEAFNDNDAAVKGFHRLFGIVRKQVSGTSSTVSLRFGALLISISNSNSTSDLKAQGLYDKVSCNKDQDSHLHKKKTSSLPVSSVPLNKKAETLKESDLKRNVKSSHPHLPDNENPWTTVKNKKRKSKDTKSLTCESSSTSSKLKNTLFPQSNIVSSSASSATSLKASDIAILLPPPTDTSQSSIDVVSSFEPAARSASSISEMTSMPSLHIPSVAVGVVPLTEAAQEISSAAVISGSLFSSAVTDKSGLMFSASTFSKEKTLSEKQRQQLQKGIKLTRKLYLDFPKEVQDQLIHTRATCLLGPDDDELHQILAMPSSDAFKKKPCELGPSIRELWLHPLHSITEKKALLTRLFFLSDNPCE